ncbi:MAG: hypothetical protein ACLF0P_08960 [Thermoanaerobaculia bacterium]
MSDTTRHEAKTLQAARRLVRDELPEAPGERQAELTRRVAELVDGEVLRERSRCADVCRYRAGLWEGTPSGPAPPEIREEARARRNEALYLADLIEAGDEFFPGADA